MRQGLGIRGGGLLGWDGEGFYGGLSFGSGDLAVLQSGFGEWDGLGREVDGAVDAVEVGEVPEVLPEGLRAPVDVAAGGLAAGEVVGSEVVVDEAGGDGLARSDGHGEQAVAEGEGGLVADAGGALGEEDDREAVAEAFRHALAGFGGAAAEAAIDVDGAGHHADPAEDGGLAELDLGDEDAGAHGAVEDDVDVGEVVGDDGAVRGDGADGGEGDVLRAKKAFADAAEPGGTEGAGAGTLDEDFEDGPGEDGGESENAVDASERAEKRQAGVSLRPFR